MKTKPSDVLYCGVRPDVIANAVPTLNPRALQAMVQMIKERYKIRLRKDVRKEPAPWTNDPILQAYRFTNVRREHDRESLWYIRNIAENPDLSYENKLLNAILYRTFNKSSTSEILGMPIDFDKLDLPAIRAKVQKYRTDNPKYVWWTAAFITGGIKRAAGSDILVHHEDYVVSPGESVPVKMTRALVKKPYPPAMYLTENEARLFVEENEDYQMVEAKEMDMVMRMINMVDRIRGDGFLDDVAKAPDQKAVFERLLRYNGLGEFLAYQIFVDFTYIPEFRFSENEFTISGPGCKNGMDILFEDRNGMTYDECIFWIRDNLERIADINFYELFEDLPEHDRKHNVMSQENIFCEFSKYWRALNETGRPRVKYKPAGEPLPGEQRVTALDAFLN